METNLCTHSFLTSSLFSHLPSCPYLCSDYYSRYTDACYSCFFRSPNVQIPKHWRNENFKVLLLASFYFWTSATETCWASKTSKRMFKRLLFSVPRKRILLFSSRMNGRRPPSGHPRSPLWKPPGLGCSTPAACCCEDIKSVHSSFS